MGHEGSIVSDFIAILLILVFVVKFIDGAKSGVKIDLNNIELFKIQETQKIEAQAFTQAASAARPKQKRNKPIVHPETISPSVVEKRNESGYTQLQQDCFDALKSLGFKTVKERKFIVNNTFNQHNPCTVQEFLKIAMSRNAPC